MPLEQEVEQDWIAMAHLFDVRADSGVEPSAFDDRVDGEERKHTGQGVVRAVDQSLRPIGMLDNARQKFQPIGLRQRRHVTEQSPFKRLRCHQAFKQREARDLRPVDAFIKVGIHAQARAMCNHDAYAAFKWAPQF